MTDYTKLVQALRCENTGDDECGSSDCTYWSGLGCMDGQLMEDAAAAIEELQDKVVEIEEELNDADVAADDNGRQVEELQAEIERLKDSNEELREKQTYIDHYGIEWLTSAKDVPNYAYKHGYADGMAEVKAQLPKRGEIVRCGECIHFTQGGWCDREFDWFPVDENDFCSMAEKMEVRDGTD